MLSKIVFKDLHSYLVTMDFTILSGFWCNSLIETNNGVFDETYINAYEDHDLSLRISQNHEGYKFIQYRIGSIGGATLDPFHDKIVAKRRTLQAISSLIYFDRRLRKIFQF